MMAKSVPSEDHAWRQRRDSANGEGVRDRIIIRQIEATDSIHELTDLLHRAFKSEGQHPYAYPVAKQNEETTHKQIERGECWVAELDGRLIGFGIVWPPRPVVRWRWYRPRQSAHLPVLAVHPDFQRLGIGTMLLNHCEQSATRMGAWELTASSPVGSPQLSLYQRMGYRIFRYALRSETNYVSVIFAKWIQKGQRASIICRIGRKLRFYYTFMAYKLGVLGCRKCGVMLKVLHKFGFPDHFERLPKNASEQTPGDGKSS